MSQAFSGLCSHHGCAAVTVVMPLMFSGISFTSHTRGWWWKSEDKMALGIERPRF